MRPRTSVWAACQQKQKEEKRSGGVGETEASSLNSKEKSSAVSDTANVNNQQPVTNVGTPVTNVGTPVAPAVATGENAPITIDDFMKVELRVGEILAAEPVPNATKLLRLTVHLDEDDTRTILAGIAEYYQPDQLVGQKGGRGRQSAAAQDAGHRIAGNAARRRRGRAGRAAQAGLRRPGWLACALKKR